MAATYGAAIMRFYSLGNDEIVGEVAQDQTQKIVAKMGEKLGLDSLAVDFGTGSHVPILHVGKLPHAFLVDYDGNRDIRAYVAGENLSPIADAVGALLDHGLRLPMA